MNKFDNGEYVVQLCKIVRKNRAPVIVNRAVFDNLNEAEIHMDYIQSTIQTGDYDTYVTLNDICYS